LFNPSAYRPNYTDGSGKVNAKAPYGGIKKECTQVVYWLTCVLLPSGLNDDSWDIHLESIGSLKMNQKLKIMFCYWDLLLFGMESMVPSYKLFYRMIAKDIQRLGMLHFNLEEVNDIQNCIIESIACWEGCLPPKTMHYKVHQLVDLPSMLKNFGSLYNWSEFAGERLLGYIKNHKLHSNTGGCSYCHLMIEKQVAKEMRIMKRFYNSSTINSVDQNAPNSSKHLKINSQNVLEFNDYPFEILAEDKNFTLLSNFEVDHLIELLIFEIKRLNDDNHDTCLSSSILYSLIHRIKIPMVKGSKNEPKYIQILIQVSKNISEKYTLQEVSVAKKLLNLHIRFYSKACIYGLPFQSRGSQYREISAQRVVSWGADHGKNQYEIRRTFDSGIRPLNWWDRKAYSSWCMYKSYDDETKFGQLNGFFKINIGDSVVDGLLVGSITSRVHEIIEHVPFVNERNSFDPDQIFVSLYDICPTLIGTLPSYRPHVIKATGLKDKKRIKAITLNENHKMKKTMEGRDHIVFNRTMVEVHAIIILHPDRMQSQPPKRNISMLLFN